MAQLTGRGRSSRRGTGRTMIALAVTAAIVLAPTPRAEAEAVPSPVVVVGAKADAAASAAVSMVDGWSIHERAGAIVMGHIPTTDTAALAEYMSENALGGFLLMTANLPGTEEALREVTAALSVSSDPPPLIAIDQEGGVVRRIRTDDFTSARALRGSPAADTRRAFAARSALVARNGATVNFGIVADVTADPRSFISSRVLGTTAPAAAERVAAAVEGERGTVASTLKHFPGHGVTAADSHRVIPEAGVTLAQWRAAESLPFAAGIDAGAELVMFGHLVYSDVDALPASLSPRWYGILRDELGFTGVAVTDDMGMLVASGEAAYADPVANTIAAVAAGSDLVLLLSRSNTPAVLTGLVAAVDSGELTAERLREAAERVTTLRLRLAAEGQVMLPCASCDAAE